VVDSPVEDNPSNSLGCSIPYHHSPDIHRNIITNLAHNHNIMQMSQTVQCRHVRKLKNQPYITVHLFCEMTNDHAILKHNIACGQDLCDTRFCEIPHDS